MRQTLRTLPPPRSSITSHEPRPTRLPAPANPIVESWLESIHPSPSTATTATTTAVAYNPLHHGVNWKSKPVTDGTHVFPPATDKEKRWLIIRSGLRATSLMLALIVIILIFCFRESSYGLDPIWIPVLTLCAMAMLCNGLDLAVAAVRGGRGIPNNFHAFTDSVIAIGIVISIALMMSQIADWVRWNMPSYFGGPYRIAVASVLFTSMAIHLCLFFSYFGDIRPSRRPKQAHMPRIMVLPSGAAVMVAPRSIPRGQAVLRPPPIEMNAMGPGSAPSSAYQADRHRSMDSGRLSRPTVLAVSRTAPLMATTSPNTTPLVRPEPVFDDARPPPRQGVPRRKPVATKAIITDSSTIASPSQPREAATQAGDQHAILPPGPDYQPDEAELQRAARGETQAQWIPPHLVGPKKGDNGPGTSTAGTENPEQDERELRNRPTP